MEESLLALNTNVGFPPIVNVTTLSADCVEKLRCGLVLVLIHFLA